MPNDSDVHKTKELRRVPERISRMKNASAARKIRNPRSAGIGLALLAALPLAGCDYFPQDPSNTLGDIRAHKVIRVGIEQPVPSEAQSLLRHIELETGAKAQFSRGGTEPLLAKLDAGKIDLVVAPFSKETPWATGVALSPPLRVEGSGKNAIEWRAAMRTGENRWIMLVEKNARRVSSAPDAS